jgi:hypothetical protein
MEKDKEIVNKFVKLLNETLDKVIEAGDLNLVHCIATILGYQKDDHFEEFIITAEDYAFLLVTMRDFEENTSIVFLERGMLELYSHHQDLKNIYIEYLNILLNMQ